jgi:hypothetical protein
MALLAFGFRNLSNSRLHDFATSRLCEFRMLWFHAFAVSMAARSFDLAMPLLRDFMVVLSRAVPVLGLANVALLMSHVVFRLSSHVMNS